MKFRKKPVVIDAEQFKGSQGKYDMFMSYPIEHNDGGEYIIIPTLAGNHIANVGDWIITGVKGEKYPCKFDIFKLTEEVSDNICWKEGYYGDV